MLARSAARSARRTPSSTALSGPEQCSPSGSAAFSSRAGQREQRRAATRANQQQLDGSLWGSGKGGRGQAPPCPHVPGPAGPATRAPARGPRTRTPACRRRSGRTSWTEKARRSKHGSSAGRPTAIGNWPGRNLVPHAGATSGHRVIGVNPPQGQRGAADLDWGHKFAGASPGTPRRTTSVSHRRCCGKAPAPASGAACSWSNRTPSSPNNDLESVYGGGEPRGRGDAGGCHAHGGADLVAVEHSRLYQCNSMFRSGPPHGEYRVRTVQGLGLYRAFARSWHEPRCGAAPRLSGATDLEAQVSRRLTGISSSRLSRLAADTNAQPVHGHVRTPPPQGPSRTRCRTPASIPITSPVERGSPGRARVSAPLGRGWRGTRAKLAEHGLLDRRPHQEFPPAGSRRGLSVCSIPFRAQLPAMVAPERRIRAAALASGTARWPWTRTSPPVRETSGLGPRRVEHSRPARLRAPRAPTPLADRLRSRPRRLRDVAAADGDRRARRERSPE